MKTILNLKIVLCVLLLFCMVVLNESCKDLPLPDPAHYLIIKKNIESSDFFINNNTYSLDTTEIFNNHGYRGKISYKLLNAYNRIYWSAATEKILFIDYKNGDIDTLSQEWVPRTSDISRPPFEELTNWKIFFNEKLVKEYDFENNPSLKEELSKRNCESCTEQGINPIVIEIKK